MTLQEYIEKRKATKFNSSIEERWQSRIVRARWDAAGEDGASMYLSQYGKGIAAPKVIALACCATAHGCPEVALGFWKRAYELEMGVSAPACSIPFA